MSKLKNESSTKVTNHDLRKSTPIDDLRLIANASRKATEMAKQKRHEIVLTDLDHDKIQPRITRVRALYSCPEEQAEALAKEISTRQIRGQQFPLD